VVLGSVSLISSLSLDTCFRDPFPEQAPGHHAWSVPSNEAAWLRK